jgi:hypothetical protein
MTESLLYKTPSPVIAKHNGHAGRGRAERVVSEKVQRAHKDWPELQGGRNRGASLGNSSEFLRNLKEEVDSIDSTMGFRELERVRLISHPANRSILQRSNDKILI